MKMKMFLRFALVLAVLFAALCLSALAYDIQGGMVKVTSAVNMREKPSTACKIIDKLYNGDRLVILDEEGGFFKIAIAGKTGYVSSEYVITEPVFNVTPGKARVTASALNVRSAPGTDNKSITKLSKGSVATIIGVNSGWFKVTTGSITGYVSPEYVEIVGMDAVDSGTSLRQRIVTYAKEFLGVPYVWGGSTPKGFDCSGLVQYVFEHFGIDMARNSAVQYSTSVHKISKSELQPGDLVFFSRDDTPGYVGHVGIYVGDGKFLHAPRAGKNVEITSLSSTYYTNHYIGSGTMLY